MKNISIVALAVCLAAGCTTAPVPLPSSSTAAAKGEIRIAADQTIHVNGKLVKPAAVAGALSSAGCSKDTPIVIVAAGNAPYQNVAQVLAQLTESGFVNVSLAVE